MSTSGHGELPLALGSWHIFSRLDLEGSMALVKRAINLGISFFDVGDYWDHENSNEERFAEIVRRLGLSRAQYRVSVKVFTNSATPRAELLKQSLQRLGVEEADYVICSRPSGGESLEQACEAMADLVKSGLARNLAVSLWTPEPLRRAFAYIRAQGLPEPKFLQLQYNVCRRSLVESDDYARLFRETGIGLQAADTLEGGILTGHLARDRFGPDDRAAGRWFTDRNLPRDSGRIRPAIRGKAPELAAAAKAMGVTPAQLAIAYCLLNPAIYNVLFGATRPEHLDENAGAVALAQTRGDEIRAAVQGLVVEGAAPPPLFDISAGVH
jgi:aryl-alcohol dehydrogenase-like predicted oxidoreductase